MSFPAEQFCSVQRARSQRRQGSHAVFHEQRELAGLRTVGEGADVGSDGDGHTGGKLLAELIRVKGDHEAFAFPLFGRRGVIGEVFEYGERRDSEDLLLTHDTHGFVAELECVIDGDNAGARGVQRTRFSGGVNSDVPADARRFIDRGFQLGFSVLIGRGEAATGERIVPGFVDLDEVGAFFELPADHRH